MNKPLVLVNKVNEVLFFSVRQVDWNNFDEWVEDRERKLQPGGKLSVNAVRYSWNALEAPFFSNRIDAWAVHTIHFRKYILIRHDLLLMSHERQIFAEVRHLFVTIWLKKINS
jgi:hypothetical protein